LWLADHDKARHLAALNPGLSPLHTARRISWTRRGERFDAGMLVPHGPAPKTGWPLVINVYGGSRISMLVDDYDPDNGILHASLLTSRGWAVMFPDLPISDHDPMRQFAPLLRSALDHLPHNLVDPSRIAIVGNSYGSYTALSLLVTMPDTFSAAAISAPLANPLASYAALRSDGAALDGFWEGAQGRMGDPPWVNPQTWVDNSPFLHLDNIDSPLLIAVGTHGLPGELAQAEQLFAGLRRLNRTTELRQYNGEGHSPSTWSPAAYTDFAQRLLTWIGASTPI
jgi:dipeptidyl aminopeptidase/acylaminoacyl peptidase